MVYRRFVFGYYYKQLLGITSSLSVRYNDTRLFTRSISRRGQPGKNADNDRLCTDGQTGSFGKTRFNTHTIAARRRAFPGVEPSGTNRSGMSSLRKGRGWSVSLRPISWRKIPALPASLRPFLRGYASGHLAKVFSAQFCL